MDNDNSEKLDNPIDEEKIQEVNTVAADENKQDTEIKHEDIEFSGFKKFWKSYSHMIMSALTILFSNIVFSIFTVVTVGFEGSSLWIGVSLYILFFASHAAFLAFFAKGKAYADFAINRLNVINAKAGKNIVSYKKVQAYKPRKGYIVGAIASIPLVIMMIISLFFIEGTSAYSIYTGFIKFLYSIFLSPFIMTNQHVAFGLFGIVVNCLAFGVSYHFFGIKLQIQQDMIDDEIKELHKESDVNGSDHIDV